MPGTRLRVSQDLAVADWIAPRLGGPFGAVSRTVPAGFAAYARICHPPGDPAGELTTWARVAAATGRRAHALMQWHALAGAPEQEFSKNATRPDAVTVKQRPPPKRMSREKVRVPFRITTRLASRGITPRAAPVVGVSEFGSTGRVARAGFESATRGNRSVRGADSPATPRAIQFDLASSRCLADLQVALALGARTRESVTDEAGARRDARGRHRAGARRRSAR